MINGCGPERFAAHVPAVDAPPLSLRASSWYGFLAASSSPFHRRPSSLMISWGLPVRLGLSSFPNSK